MSKQRANRRRNRQGVRSGLGAAGLLVLAAAGSVASGCFGQPDPPDMPPFAGTEEFLDEQARVHRGAAAEEAFREKFNLGDPAAVERRGRLYLQQRALYLERSRQIEEANERERQRRAKERAEEGKRRFEEMAQKNQYRVDLGRERDKAAEGKRRFAEIAKANQNRKDLRHQQELESEGKRRFAETEFLNANQKRESARKDRERKEDSRVFFADTQARRS